MQQCCRQRPVFKLACGEPKNQLQVVQTGIGEADRPTLFSIGYGNSSEVPPSRACHTRRFGLCLTFGRGSEGFAMKQLLLTILVAMSGLVCARANIHVIVSIRSQTAWLMDHNRIVMTSPVCTAKRG